MVQRKNPFAPAQFLKGVKPSTMAEIHAGRHRLRYNSDNNEAVVGLCGLSHL